MVRPLLLENYILQILLAVNLVCGRSWKAEAGWSCPCMFVCPQGCIEPSAHPAIFLSWEEYNKPDSTKIARRRSLSIYYPSTAAYLDFIHLPYNWIFEHFMLPPKVIFILIYLFHQVMSKSEHVYNYIEPSILTWSLKDQGYINLVMLNKKANPSGPSVQRLRGEVKVSLEKIFQY